MWRAGPNFAEEADTDAAPVPLRPADNIVWQETSGDKAALFRALGQSPCVLWLTGPPKRCCLCCAPAGSPARRE